MTTSTSLLANGSAWWAKFRSATGSRKKKQSARSRDGIFPALRQCAIGNSSEKLGRRLSQRATKYEINFGGTGMKKLWIAMLTMCLALPLFALAQESGQGGMGQTAPSTGAKHASVK